MDTDRELVVSYLKKNEGITDKRAEEMFEKLKTHPDILAEFVSCIKDGDFKFCAANPISVEGYTAQMLIESTFLSPIGAYNYLIYLRNNPKDALRYLEEGLPVE